MVSKSEVNFIEKLEVLGMLKCVAFVIIIIIITTIIINFFYIGNHISIFYIIFMLQ